MSTFLETKVVQLVASKVDDLNTGNHDTKSTSKGNIHGNTEKGVIIIYSQICHLATIVITFILEVQILLSIIFLHPLIKVLHREINILVMETCKQVVARENNKTNNCKVGHVNNNCNENVGLSILNNGGVKDSRKLTAFERALALSK
ncbi:hypothetical protein RhiirC2_742094 [Rhizophagus irregularis]|uniref:Uncharacterized protein n=1 Tax=Rhizophagus irregularis TaxID=588596 RepID=A0A2N1NFV9_9GLOM|nr:hypothetical protein RhiirC2_742094 [Rhizophagus irregularis]